MSQQFPDLGVDVPELTAEELKRRLDDGERIGDGDSRSSVDGTSTDGARVTLLDTRRPDDFESWHVDHPSVDAVNVPFTAFLEDGEPADEVPEGVPDGPLVVSCAKGISSRFVAEFLAREGREVEALSDGMVGWARLYEATEIDAPTGGATVVQYHRPSSGCLSYMIVEGDEAAVVDPLRAFVERYDRDARERGAEVVAAIDTHVHADHVSGLRALAELTGADRVLPAGASERGLAFDATLVAGGAPGSDDGDAIDVGDTALRAVALPGHTTEMTGFRVGDVLLAGDTVFTDAVARPDLEAEGDAEPAARRLHATLQELAALDDLVIAPGHTSGHPDGAVTASVADLRERLPAFSMDEDAFAERVLANLPPQPANHERIIEANLGRAEVADDEAFELELGPNNCAAG